MRKGWKKEKEKGFQLWWAVGGILAQPGAPHAGANSPTQLRPKVGDGMGARERRRLRGAHTPERAEGGRTASAVDGGMNRPSAGEDPAAGGLGGDSPPVTRFLGNG
jgi:hypothetical protein